ncbi:putative heart- and neural crest derivatives-expressed protein 2-like [Penaeus vannamei]|uniref:Putative heart-and neural crest derivatives-expressed protein 2-like n=1 Tax=Penaeus vannamei TaxID=6689 RepID=A0A3R7P8R5_PENVA|nr:putative heart- and neural crest derivatives-expressed protein 2-like [Penaeus vannamei]
MSSGCEGGWPGYPYCAYPPPPPPQWSAHPHHHYHHHHHHTPDFCSPQPPAPPPPLVTYGDGSAIPPCPQHYWDGDDLVDECGRVIRRKTSANKKERRRTQSINNAFAELRECIPNVPADTKLSKIKTLRLATSYIAYLMEVLHTEDSTAAPPPEPFRANLPPRTRPSQAISGDHDKLTRRAFGSSNATYLDRKGRLSTPSKHPILTGSLSCPPEPSPISVEQNFPVHGEENTSTLNVSLPSFLSLLLSLLFLSRRLYPLFSSSLSSSLPRASPPHRSLLSLSPSSLVPLSSSSSSLSSLSLPLHPPRPSPPHPSPLSSSSLFPPFSPSSSLPPPPHPSPSSPPSSPSSSLPPLLFIPPSSPTLNARSPALMVAIGEIKVVQPSWSNQ